jgi:hypothetical protein
MHKEFIEFDEDDVIASSSSATPEQIRDAVERFNKFPAQEKIVDLSSIAPASWAGELTDDKLRSIVTGLLIPN